LSPQYAMTVVLNETFGSRDEHYHVGSASERSKPKERAVGLWRETAKKVLPLISEFSNRRYR
jgi:hypothetical protein